jgi:hypothetical protein
MQLTLSSRGLWHILRAHYDLGVASTIVDSIMHEARRAEIDDEGTLVLVVPDGGEAQRMLQLVCSGRGILQERPAGQLVELRLQPAEDRMAYL